jgi:outer membrane receptor for ferrienterochelin and colicin
MKTRLLFLVLLALPTVLLSSGNVTAISNTKAETKIIKEIDRFYSKHEGDFDESAKTRFKNKYNDLIESRRARFKQLDKDVKSGTMDSRDCKKERTSFLQDQEEELKVEGALLQNCCLKVKK